MSMWLFALSDLRFKRHDAQAEKPIGAAYSGCVRFHPHGEERQQKMYTNQLDGVEVFDLETLKFQPGRLNLPLAGRFLGDKTPQATYKSIERGNFPVTLTPRASGGFWVLKAHHKKYLEDGLPQPQTCTPKPTPAAPAGEKRGRGRPSHKSKAALAAKTGGESCI